MSLKKLALLSLFAQTDLSQENMYEVKKPRRNPEYDLPTRTFGNFREKNFDGLQNDLTSNSDKIGKSFFVQGFDVKAVNLKNANKIVRKMLADNGFYPDTTKEEIDD